MQSLLIIIPERLVCHVLSLCSGALLKKEEEEMYEWRMLLTVDTNLTHCHRHPGNQKLFSFLFFINVFFLVCLFLRHAKGV